MRSNGVTTRPPAAMPASPARNANPLVDGNNGQQVTASNVVIMEVQHDLTDLPEDSVNG